MNSDKLNSISLKCNASDLRLNERDKCPHNSDTLPDLCRSFVYLRNKKSKEIKIQKLKRECLIDYQGHDLS